MNGHCLADATFKRSLIQVAFHPKLHDTTVLLRNGWAGWNKKISYTASIDSNQLKRQKQPLRLVQQSHNIMASGDPLALLDFECIVSSLPVSILTLFSFKPELLCNGIELMRWWVIVPVSHQSCTLDSDTFGLFTPSGRLCITLGSSCNLLTMWHRLRICLIVYPK